MATLNLNGRKVTVDDSFLALPPDKQNAAVEEIFASLNGDQKATSTTADPYSGDAYSQTAGPGVRQELKMAGGALDNFVRMAANGMTFGLADKFAGGMDALTGAAPSYDAGVKAQRAQTEAVRQQSPGLALGAEVAGGLGTGIGAVRSGLTLAGRVGPGLFPRFAGFGAEGAAYGAASGAGNTYSDFAGDYAANAAKGGALGAMVGGALPVLGSTASNAYRLGSSFLGPRVAGAGSGASALMRTAALADEQGIRNLPNLGPAAMLPDAGPSMLGLAQGAGTGTGTGRTALVNALRERDVGVVPRLAQALDQNLGPAPVPSQVEAGIAANRRALGPEYERAFENSRAVNLEPLALELDYLGIVARGPAQDAAQSVRQMLNVHGTDVLERDPRTLLGVRQAIDGMLDGATDGNVRRVLTQARRAVDDELAANVPGIKAVDARYAELARQSEGLERGGQVFDTGRTATRPVELRQEIQAAAQPSGQVAGPSAVPVRMRQGARAELDRVVGTQANDLNALERKLATPQDWNTRKLVELFGQGPAGNVAQTVRGERRMRQTFQDVVQNSQTAQRLAAARDMDGTAGGNIPLDMTLTGVGTRGLNALVKILSGASSERTKNEIGNLLASRGPEVQRLAQLLLASAQTTNANTATIARLLGNPALIGASSPVAGRR